MKECNQVAVVTGSGRGIGRAIAKRLAGEGMRVGLLARTAPELEETEADIRKAGGEALSVATDVTDETEVQHAFDAIRSAYGPADLVVNNAGRFNTIGPVWEVDPAEWWRDVTVNIKGVFLCCRAALEQMRPRGSGRIINMIGGGTGGPFPYGSGYGSSKAAVMRLTESMAKELKDEGIGVFALGPGLVRTAMTGLQLHTEAGKKYFGHITELFEKGTDLPPTRAAEAVARIAGGRLDRLTGRALHAGEDLDAVEAAIDDILAQDRKTLRLT